MKIFGREQSAAKQFVDGTHRACSPRATLAAHVPKMKTMGITRLADVTGLDVVGVPVYMAVRPNSRALAVSQGKGLDRDAAKASALMESIESWHAERIAAPLRHESYAALRRTARVVDVTRLALERGATLEPNTPRLWIEGHDLLAGAPAWVPFECVMTNFVRPGHARRTFITGSNGLASGNHLLEAVAHGLFEVIERDAATLWRLSADERTRSRLDLATVEPPRCRAVLDQLRRAGLETVVWDATADTGVPTFVCRVMDRPDEVRWALRGVFEGQGAHLSAEVAFLRAVTEAIQSRLTQIAGSRDDVFAHADVGNPDNVRIALQSAWNTPAVRTFASGDLATETFEGDVAVLLAALERIGIDSAVVVDLTRPELGIPVVRVVVPGLEGDSVGPGYAPGARARARRAAGQR